MVLHPIRVLETPTIDVIVGILAEHRWKHLVQIGQLLPSQYQLLIFAWYTKISSRNERTWEPMMRTQFGANYNCGGSGCSARKPTMECGGASICQHNRQRKQCKECGGASICQHARRRSTCKECGGSSICQHNRIRSRCKTCLADKDESMPLGLEEL